MIDKLTYDQVLEISKSLKEEAGIVDRLAKERGLQDLQDFAATVEGYSKFLENTINMNKDADIALADLKKER